MRDEIFNFVSTGKDFHSHFLGTRQDVILSPQGKIFTDLIVGGVITYL